VHRKFDPKVRDDDPPTDRGYAARLKQPRRGRPRLPSAKVLISLRLDPDVLEHYRATGAGWGGRVNETLRKAMTEAAEPRKTGP
jgi:uncharacterized protein (DUF4415 family)